MSSSTRPSELALGGDDVRRDDVSARTRIVLRVVLAVAYPLLAHAASHHHDDGLAAIALVDIALVVLIEPLLARKAWAWAAMVPLVAGASWLARTGHALLPLLLVPVAIIGFVGYGFGRTLLAGRTPLITRIVAGLDAVPPQELSPDLRRYTRQLTACWATLLFSLAMLNLLLALLAVPDGLLAGLGIRSPLAVSRSQWSWFANILNYGIVGGFFLLEFSYRQRRFPGRYHHFLDFLRRMARLGPAFWRDVFR